MRFSSKTPTFDPKNHDMRSQLALALLALLFSCSEPATRKDMDPEKAATFDWQGHRGARGLLPENTVPAFLKALEYPQVKTLELDLAVSQDGLLVVSHEPWMNYKICSHPDGRPVLENEEDELILYQMPYDSIRQYDCGSRGNAGYPQQKAMPVHKPLFREVVRAAEQYCQEKGRPMPRYNIEIKFEPEYVGVKAPDAETFARLVLEEITRLGIKERCCIQSFDVGPLQHLHRMDPGLFTALLIDNAHGVEDNLNELGYLPNAYSPYYKLVTANMVKIVHDKGLLLIPWTVNDTTAMKALIALGVDGIITDYPNLIGAVE